MPNESPTAATINPPPRPRLAVTLWILGASLALLATGGLAWDIVAPDVAPGTPTAQAGFRVGALLGILMRTVVLGVGALFLIFKGMQFWRPARYGGAALTKNRLRGIAAATQDFAASAANPELGRYRHHTDAELLGIYVSIRRDAVPARFAELVREIRERVREMDA